MDTETIASTVLNEEQLSLDLIEAQYALMNTRDQSNAKSLVILVSGIELAGKGEAVNSCVNGSIRVFYMSKPIHRICLI